MLIVQNQMPLHGIVRHLPHELLIIPINIIIILAKFLAIELTRKLVLLAINNIQIFNTLDKN